MATAEVIEPTVMHRVKWYIRDLSSKSIAAWRSACDWLKWLGHKEGNIERHARRELELAEWFDKDGMYGDMMGHAVMKMIREFSEEGHSGMSAGVAIGLFKEVSKFKPLTPLTGEPGEWNEVGEGVFQNRRASNVFKDEDGRAYNIDGKVFREPDGCTYTSQDSRIYITFPYTPITEYVDVPEQTGNGD